MLGWEPNDAMQSFGYYIFCEWFTMQQVIVNGKLVDLKSAESETRDEGKEYYFLLKRCTDMILASFFLVALSPLLLLIAVLIKMDSRGPVIFVHQRAGCRRRTIKGKQVWEVRPFPFYKFRSMVPNADESLHQAHIHNYIHAKLDDTGVIQQEQKVTNDPRVTRIGRIIRKTSLDELPQLVNVLRGEMSLVGPRPIPMYEFEEYQVTHYERMTSWPGITGLWQVSGRALTTFDQQMDLDIRYIHEQSWWMDMKILFLTLPTILSGKGAM